MKGPIQFIIHHIHARFELVIILSSVLEHTAPDNFDLSATRLLLREEHTIMNSS